MDDLNIYTFLPVIRSHNLPYTLLGYGDTIMVYMSPKPEQRWEVDFVEDGNVETQVFFQKETNGKTIWQLIDESVIEAATNFPDDSWEKVV